MPTRRKIAITVGDPSGIGPELIVRALPGLCSPDVEPVIYATAGVLERASRGLSELGPVALPESGWRLVDVGPGMDTPTPGKPGASAARIQFAALDTAITDALAGDVDAIVTAPWTKHILPLAGEAATGHTEVLGSRCGVPRPTMMLCGDVLRVALATVHIPISEVPKRLTTELVTHHIAQLAGSLREDFGLRDPRIAVCGLNPHAGEHGIMGSEDEDVIRPAIADAQEAGISAQGPFPADTLFAKVARQGSHDAVLAMYHDQGLAPLKLWHFGESANVTLGLPIIRTSVDHGSAHDIAGRGIADTGSFEYACSLAVRMAENRAGGSRIE
ncbi:MAG: 4-hydroxythreonine-4-phosphate dehydrogenase PdxA [Myxococcales bacterium]|nr:4-hydroxythreonine-4-phosphate dehydrogenase PdxA [Myxococcales bacterium]